MLEADFIDQFEHDVADHRLTIVHEDGLYRHLRFSKPGSNDMRFDLVTWPGFLAYSGDMGAFMFERTNDMLGFFRRDPGERKYGMSLRYWAEKCEAEGTRGDGIFEFDPDEFKRAITRQRRELLVEHGRTLDDGQRQDLWDELQRVIDAADEDEIAAWSAMRDFSFVLGYDRKQSHAHINTDDFPRCERYTQRFMWCCCALAWGIEVYDRIKAAALLPAAA